LEQGVKTNFKSTKKTRWKGRRGSGHKKGNGIADQEPIRNHSDAIPVGRKKRAGEGKYTKEWGENGGGERTKGGP